MMNCEKTESQFTLYLYGELADADRIAFEEHLRGCAACRRNLEQIQALHQLLSRRKMDDASPELLAWCRQALDSAIEREASRISWRNLARSFASSWGALPATPGAWVLALVLAGFGLGWTIRPLFRRAAAPAFSAAVPASAESLGDFRISGIRQVMPGADSGEVDVTVDAEREVTLKGSLDNPRIRRLLVEAMKGYDNPGIRRETLDALSTRANDPTVQGALLYALERDPNVGVRLKALQAVSRMHWTGSVQHAVLHALLQDQNPGVRVAAINLLVKHANPTVLPALRRMAMSDPNAYVRLMCERAVRDAGPHAY